MNFKSVLTYLWPVGWGGVRRERKSIFSQRDFESIHMYLYFVSHFWALMVVPLFQMPPSVSRRGM
jgi:hypothetical protein